MFRSTAREILRVIVERPSAGVRESVVTVDACGEISDRKAGHPAMRGNMSKFADDGPTVRKCVEIC